MTDAHVVLGRIAAEQFLGGGMEILPERAAQAVDRIATQLSLSREQAAAGIIRVANANRERAIRVVSIERGYDPREFTLVAFGGGGGLHVCELASELGVRTIVVPRYAEGISALGMLLADRVRDYAAGVLGRTDLDERFQALEKEPRAECGRKAKLERAADLHYAGQSYELTVPSLRSAQGRGGRQTEEAQRLPPRGAGSVVRVFQKSLSAAKRSAATNPALAAPPSSTNAAAVTPSATTRQISTPRRQRNQWLAKRNDT